MSTAKVALTLLFLVHQIPSATAEIITLDCDTKVVRQPADPKFHMDDERFILSIDTERKIWATLPDWDVNELVGANGEEIILRRDLGGNTTINRRTGRFSSEMAEFGIAMASEGDCRPVEAVPFPAVDESSPGGDAGQGCETGVVEHKIQAVAPDASGPGCAQDRVYSGTMCVPDGRKLLQFGVEHVSENNFKGSYTSERLDDRCLKTSITIRAGDVRGQSPEYACSPAHAIGLFWATYCDE